MSKCLFFLNPDFHVKRICFCFVCWKKNPICGKNIPPPLFHTLEMLNFVSMEKNYINFDFCIMLNVITRVFYLSIPSTCFVTFISFSNRFLIDQSYSVFKNYHELLPQVKHKDILYKIGECHVVQ